MTEIEFYNKLQDTEEGREYLALVSSCKVRSLKPEPGFEIHHVFLTSLGGENVSENKVKFTVFEHCRAHALLAKAIPCYKTLQPIVMMSNGQVQKLDDLEEVTLEEQLEWSKLREKALHQPKSPEHVARMRASKIGKPRSKEASEKSAAHRRGKITVNDGVREKFISKEELEEYLKQGWIRGRTEASKHTASILRKGKPSSERGKKCITKDGREKKVFPEEIEQYTKDGWRVGRCRSFSEKRTKFLTGKQSYTKGRKRIYNKEGKELLIPKEQIEGYLSRGWFLGTPRKHIDRILESKNLLNTH